VKPLLEHRLLLAAPCPSPSPALFLDRDGVLIQDKHYLSDPDKVVLCHGAKALVEQASHHQRPVIVITNQSGIARGYFLWQEYEQVTDRLLNLLGSTAPLAGIYANGHGPDAPPTSWRKPSPAMLLAAAEDLNLDMSRSLLIGDRLSDLKAGKRAGLPLLAHVLTGYGAKERKDVEHWGSQIQQQPTNKNPDFELMLQKSLLDFPIDRIARSG